MTDHDKPSIIETIIRDQARRFVMNNIAKSATVETQGGRPRICEVLGVEVGEPFDFGSGTYIILETIGGEFLLYYFGQNSAPGSEVLSKMIAHRDRIIRKPRFTEEEVADARAIERFFGGKNCLCREPSGLLRVNTPGGFMITGICRDLFPSVLPGQSVALADICGC